MNVLSGNSFTLPPGQLCPAVSVVIPMYNAEKYIGECLDSILNQTFQDFEVIVVDDCSTDNSRAVVESYVEKFGGRLKLERTLENSGGGAFPRNKGVKLSRGEYLLIVDNDDAITLTALEELYTIAKNFDADVVSCTAYYIVPDKFWHNAEFRHQLKPYSYYSGNLVEEPTLLTNDISARLQLLKYGKEKFLWNTWTKLIRRDLIFEHEFNFSKTIIDDIVFTICLLCTAERFLLVPNIVNHYRVREDSISHNKILPEEFIRNYFKAFSTAFRYLDKFLNGREEFRKNSYVRYLVFEICWNALVNYYFLQLYENNSAYEFDKILMEEFSSGNNVALAAFSFNIGIFYRHHLTKLQECIAELEKTAQQDKAYIAELENFVAKLLNKE